jgi:sulfide dehydrogenase cytochrome subunit
MDSYIDTKTLGTRRIRVEPRHHPGDFSKKMQTAARLAMIFLIGVAIAVRAAEFPSARPGAAMLSHNCAGCHGTFGRSSGKIPSINGLPEAQFIRAMQDFKSGKRRASVMDRIARGYQYEDFAAMAKFFAAQK